MHEPSNLFVCLLGIGTVFFGLICLILLCKIIGLFTAKSNTATQKENAAKPISAVSPANQQIENRQEIIAAVSAAIAEELGTDISALRIISFKKI